jgi:ATP-dependent Lon protease
MIFPKNWEFPSKILEKVQAEQNEKYNGEGYFLIFVSELDEQKLNNLLDSIADLITFNLEKQEKEMILREKVQELKEIFKMKSLDEVKNIEIKFPEFNEIDDLLDEEEEI